MGWLEREACYTRTGRNGVRQVETTGLIAAQFTHRDSRDGDPNLSRSMLEDMGPHRKPTDGR